MNIILGTAQFGLDYGITNHDGQVALSEVRNIVARAESLNIRHFDTAPVYGNSESILGEVLGERACITTKIPPRSQDGLTDSEWILTCIQGSLSSLGRTRIDELLFHRTVDLVNCNQREITNLLADLKRTGLINKIGVSVYDFDELNILLSSYDIDIVQAPFNMLDTRLVHDGWLPSLRSKGVRVDVRSVFLQGLLISAAAKKHRYFNRWNFIFDKVVKFKSKHPDVSYLDLCLQFVKQHPAIENIIVGVQSERELLEIAQAFHMHRDITLPDFSCTDTDLINPSNWQLS